MSEGHVLVIGAVKNLEEPLRRHFPGDVSIFCAADVLALLTAPASACTVVGFSPQAGEAEWVAAARLLHEHHPVTVLACHSEREMGLYAAIGEALGLAAHRPETVLLSQDKGAMRDRLRTAGVDATRSLIVNDEAGLRAAVAEIGAPVVAKPNTGAGSRGIAVLHSPDDAAAVFAAVSEAGMGGGQGAPPVARQLVVEQLLEGPEYSVDSLSEGGEHRCVCIARTRTEEHAVELGHQVPAAPDPEVAAAIRATVADTLDALGVREGCCHTEVKVGRDGVHVLETHLRPGGDDIPELFADVTGIDLIDLRARQLSGQRVLPVLDAAVAGFGDSPRSGYVAFGLVRSTGRVVAVEGMEEAAAMPGVVAARASLTAGKRLSGAQDSWARGFLVRVVADDAKAAREQALAACAVPRVVLEADLRLPEATDDETGPTPERTSWRPN